MQRKKKKVEAEVAKLKEILGKSTIENMTDANVEEIKVAKEALMTVFQELSAKLYQQAGAAGAAPGAEGGPAPEPEQQTNNDDDVVDADFKEV